ncbi:hypothetical protein O3P69_012777, partial [Scylla paramamosain]
MNKEEEEEEEKVVVVVVVVDLRDAERRLASASRHHSATSLCGRPSSFIFRHLLTRRGKTEAGILKEGQQYRCRQPEGRAGTQRQAAWSKGSNKE